MASSKAVTAAAVRLGPLRGSFRLAFDADKNIIDWSGPNANGGMADPYTRNGIDGWTGSSAVVLKASPRHLERSHSRSAARSSATLCFRPRRCWACSAGAGNGALHSRPDYASTIDCTDDAENFAPRSLTKPSFASSAATSRSER